MRKVYGRVNVPRANGRSTCLLNGAFQDVSPEEQRQLEGVLKRIGKRAEELGEQESH
jgi:hypothetical protein